MLTLRRTFGALAVVVAFTAASCGQGNNAEQPDDTSGQAGELIGVCPDPLVVQTSWFPEMEFGWLWQLIGPDGQRDPETGSYRGPVGDTGVDLEIRAGGPFLGRQQPIATIYQNRDILFAIVGTAETVKNVTNFPTVAVLGIWEKDPQGLMFNPDKFNFQSIEDVREQGTRVLYFEGSDWMDYLVGEGLLSAEQVDASYTGAPDRWVATDGGVVQAAFISQEPLRYENELPQWMKPVSTLLLADLTRYQPYGSLVVRQDALQEQADCLREVIPLMQQAIVDFTDSDVRWIAEEIQMLNEEIGDFWQTSVEHNLAGLQVMLEHGIISNGPNDTIGDFDLERVAEQIDIYQVLSRRGGIEVPENLSPEDVVTNDFIDPSIGL